MRLVRCATIEIIFLQCLIEANVKLQEYDHERTNFLTRVVHDFRAPLTALNGYCGLLLGDPLGSLNEKQQEVIRRMQYSVRRLSRMASGMLQLTVERETQSRPGFKKGRSPEKSGSSFAGDRISR